MFHIVPIQILDTVLLPVLQTPLHLAAISPQFVPPAIHIQTGFTLIPSLNLKLSDHWSTVLAPKIEVATNDLANINQSIWDQLIILVSPKVSVIILDWFRPVILGKQF